MMLRPLPLLLTITALCAADRACGSPGARYVGMFADGTRVEGNVITGWHSDKAEPTNSMPSRLFDPERPLRWLRNNEPDIGPVGEDATAFVELIGGDRLPGRLVGGQPRDVEWGGAPGQWVALVQSRMGLDPQPPLPPRTQVHVDAAAIARVVWQGDSLRHLRRRAPCFVLMAAESPSAASAGRKTAWRC